MLGASHEPQIPESQSLWVVSMLDTAMGGRSQWPPTAVSSMLTTQAWLIHQNLAEKLPPIYTLWSEKSLIRLIFAQWVSNVMLMGTRALSQYKDSLSMYGDFHYKDKKVVRPSYLYNGNSYTGKSVSLYWDGPQVVLWCVPDYLACQTSE